MIFKNISHLILLINVMFFAIGSAGAMPNSFSPIVKSEREKVVHISTSSVIDHSSMFRDPFFEQFFKGHPKPGKKRQSALGTGFIISEDGYIVTNSHVVEKAEKIEVVLFNDKKYSAEIIGIDVQTDLALLKIGITKHAYVKFGDSSAIEVGDWVLAIGNPLGLDHSVTAGIISAKNRGIFGESVAYGQFLQTDAAINPGNSGGPLFNMSSEVIGINTAIVSGGQGLGFAIPANLAQKIIGQLKKDGKVIRGYFGVVPQEVSEELAASFGLPSGVRGIVLTHVSEDSPAGRAGLQLGDVVVEYEGKPLTREGQFRQYIAETVPGERVHLKIFRDGKMIRITVKVIQRPESESVSAVNGSNDYGMRLTEITPQTREKLRLTNEHGLVVYQIDQTGVAWEKGIRQNDIILKANGKPVKTIREFNTAIRESQKKKHPIRLLIQRDGNARFVALPIK